MASNYTPIAPNQYKNDQIILNSGRLLFNAKSDAVLLFASKAIGLSSAGTINLDSDDNIILNSKKIIELGLNAYLNGQGQPVAYGGHTSDTLVRILTQLESLCNQLVPFLSSVPSLAPANLVLGNVSTQLSVIKTEIAGGLLSSKKTYTL